MTEPRTYEVEMRGKVYQRTAKHIRPRINFDEPVKNIPLMLSLQTPVIPITPQVTPVKKIKPKPSTPKPVLRVTSPKLP